MPMRSFRIPLLALALLAPPWGLAAPPIPAIEPGRVERDLRPPPEPSSQPSPPGREPARVEPSATEQQIRFLLQGVELRGNQALSTAELEGEWREMLGRETSLAEIKEVARRITSRYRNAGYILSQAVVPAQEVRNGVVAIEVVEGFVSRVVPEEGRTLEGKMAEYAAHIPQSRPLHIGQLERWLLLMNDLPGATAQSVLRPSPELPGAADLSLKAERRPYAALLALNNRAGAYYQDWAMDLSATANDLLGFDEELFLRAALAGDAAAGDGGGYRNFNLGLGLPLGAEGGRFDLGLEQTTSVPGYTLEGLGYEGDSKAARLLLSYPLERSRSRSLYGQIGFDMADSGMELDSTTLTDDRLRVVRAGLRLDWAGGGGLTLLQLEGSAGLGIFGASEAGDSGLSRADGDGRFLKLYLDLVHLRPLWEGGQLRVDIIAQASDRKLLSDEEFGLGGARIGRGYDNSEITGDQGAGIGLEFSHKLPRDLQAYGFYDIGRVAGKTGGRESLSSAGGGVRFQYSEQLRGQLEFAAPLTRAVAAVDPGDGNDWRLFFSLSVAY